MPLSETPLVHRDAIAARVAALGATLSRDYAGRPLLALVVMKGALLFAADLLRQVDVPLTLDFIRAKSYAGQTSTGSVAVTALPETPVAGRDVLLIEDIVDTGRTLEALVSLFEDEGARSVAVATLLDKPSRRVVPVTVQYVGFTIEDRFVVGYGLDHDEHYRNLPDIHTLDTLAGGGGQ